MAIPSFVDRVVLHVTAGNGGHGCVSVHREKFKPLGGPDGGNGGHGGDVIVEVDPNTTTLLDYHRSPHRRARNGAPGEGGHRDGAKGADVILPVPDGTVVSTKAGDVLVDLGVGDGPKAVLGAVAGTCADHGPPLGAGGLGGDGGRAARAAVDEEDGFEVGAGHLHQPEAVAHRRVGDVLVRAYGRVGSGALLG
jgi:GTP-binding protein